jgi:hypothetical protein
MAGRTDYMPPTETVKVGGADRGSRTGPMKAKGKSMTPPWGANDPDMDGDDEEGQAPGNRFSPPKGSKPRFAAATRAGSALPPNAGNARRGVPMARNLSGDDELGQAPGDNFRGGGKGTKARIAAMGRLRALGRMK